MHFLIDMNIATHSLLILVARKQTKCSGLAHVYVQFLLESRNLQHPPKILSRYKMVVLA